MRGRPTDWRSRGLALSNIKGNRGAIDHQSRKLVARKLVARKLVARKLVARKLVARKLVG
jgi:hypothetical protein